MDLTRLRQRDLNLLVAFLALAEEGGVSRAARRLGLSQSAASAALARLRELLGDPLLVRRGRKMMLTPRARALRRPVAEALGRVLEIVEPAAAFEPRRAERTLHVLLLDFANELLLPPLMARLAREAPRVALHVRSAYPPAAEELERGDLDLWVLSDQLRHPRCPHALVLESPWVIVGCARHHRPSERPLRADQLAKLRFVIGDESRERAIGTVVPETREFRERVAKAVVHDHWNVHVLRGTPLVRAVPACLVHRLGRGAGLVSVGRLARARPHRLTMQWRPEEDGDPAIRWLRDVVAEEAARLAGRARSA
jgi:LysR family transcriptional regulator, nod-box dependent transcriptional activator